MNIGEIVRYNSEYPHRRQYSEKRVGIVVNVDDESNGFVRVRWPGGSEVNESVRWIEIVEDEV